MPSDQFAPFQIIRRMFAALGYVHVDSGFYELEVDNGYGFYLCGYVNSNMIEIRAYKPIHREMWGKPYDKIKTEDVAAAQLFVRSWHFRNENELT